jgi:hypothetical protein
MTLHEAIEEMREWIEAAKQQSPGAILNIGTKVQTALPAMEVVVAAAEQASEKPMIHGGDYAPGTLGDILGLNALREEDGRPATGGPEVTPWTRGDWCAWAAYAVVVALLIYIAIVTGAKP